VVRRVYATLEAVDGQQQQQFVGDVLVFDEGGRMVAALCGCRFAKMLISKLERVLDSAGPVKQQQVVGLNSASLGSFAAGAGTGTGTEVSSINLTPPSTSTPSAHEPSDSGHGLLALRDMIAEYTGLDGSAVPADTVLSDLGLDSLASVEMAEQLSSTLGLAIDADGLAMATLSDLTRRLGHYSGGASRELSPYPEPNEPEAEESSSHIVEYGKLLSILSELSGAKAQDIETTHALVDLGIDSLSLVELQDSLRDSFSVQLDDLVLDSTVQELMTHLGIVGRAAGSDTTRGEPSSAVAVDSTVPEKDDEPEGAGLILENPFDALESSNAHFNTSAGKRGFLGYWTDVAQLQDELTLAYIVEAFSALGVDLRQIPCGQQVPQVPHLTHKHNRLMARLWEILQRHNLVSVDQAGDRTRGRGQINGLSSAELHAALQARYPSIKDEADLMSLTGPRLADCLSGTTDPVSLMFGNPASLKIMENYYSQSPMLSTMTEQLVIFLMILFKGAANSRARPMRILEVGAGTGGTTRRLAEAFVSAGIAVQYVFTDISPGLVSKAKGKFKHYPWIEYATLDLEKEVPAKFRNQFDVVIGTNCVHATTDRTASCRRLRDTLTAGGVLVLSEVTRVIDWYDVAFGLLDGWWVAEGRTAYPLQPAEWWMSTFRVAGFACASYSRGATPEANTQRLLVACTKQWLSPTGDYGITASPAEKEDAFHLKTMVYKEVSGVKIHADVYFPRRPGKAPMPIGMLPYPITNSTTNIYLTSSPHDSRRWLHDTVPQSHPAGSDTPSPRQRLPARQHRLPALSRGEHDRRAHRRRV
jgi:acyl carrier protein/SAM-dependent methyltransferase